MWKWCLTLVMILTVVSCGKPSSDVEIIGIDHPPTEESQNDTANISDPNPDAGSISNSSEVPSNYLRPQNIVIPIVAMPRITGDQVSTPNNVKPGS